MLFILVHKHSINDTHVSLSPTIVNKWLVSFISFVSVFDLKLKDYVKKFELALVISYAFSRISIDIFTEFAPSAVTASIAVRFGPCSLQRLCLRFVFPSTACSALSCS